MAQNSNKVLDTRHISEPTREILNYIDNRRKGIIRSLRTKWIKFNRNCMGGIEPNTIYSIVGISGAGKSSFANSLESDLFELNPNGNFVVLSFSFEMLASKNVGRKLSYKLKKTTSELYSGDETRSKLENSDYDQVVAEAKIIEQYPIYYVDRPGSVEEIRNTILDFRLRPEIKGKWLIIFLDHSLLTKNVEGEKERETLFLLQKMFMEIKKYDQTTIIQLSQMNKNIEDKERILNPNLHFPMRSDVMGGDSLFTASDYVMVLHRPELLGITSYGSSNWPVKNLVYLHIVKNREGEPKILVFENNLKYNTLDEHNVLSNL
jgi:replicative DNA helicase